MAGFIYIMSNPAFPNLLKIGKSKKDPTTDRVNELNQTGVPEPFKVEYYAFVEDEDYLEKAVHRKFASNRPNKNREFFSVDCVEAIDAIRQLSEPRAKIKLEETYYVSPEELKRFAEKREKEERIREEERDRRFKAEAEAARQAARERVEREEAEAIAKKEAEEKAERSRRIAKLEKDRRKKKVANVAFLCCLPFLLLVLLPTMEKALGALLLSLLISGLLWISLWPKYDN